MFIIRAIRMWLDARMFAKIAHECESSDGLDRY